MSKFYVQNVLKLTYSNGAVRFEYLPVEILKYHYMEYESPRDNPFCEYEATRFLHVHMQEKKVIEEILKPAPELLIFERGNFTYVKFKLAFELAERTTLFLQEFHDVPPNTNSEEEPVLETIHVIEVRREYKTNRS